MCRNSQTGCHHLSPQLSSAVHHGQQQQRDLWGTRFSPLQCSGEVAGSLERRGSPREFPGYTAAFSRHKPTSLTQRGYGHTAGVLLSAAVTLMHRWVPQMYARCMQKFLFFFFCDGKHVLEKEKKKSFTVRMHWSQTTERRLEAILSRWGYETKLIKWVTVWISMKKARSYQLVSQKI